MKPWIKKITRKFLREEFFLAQNNVLD